MCLCSFQIAMSVTRYGINWCSVSDCVQCVYSVHFQYKLWWVNLKWRVFILSIIFWCIVILCKIFSLQQVIPNCYPWDWEVKFISKLTEKATAFKSSIFLLVNNIWCFNSAYSKYKVWLNYSRPPGTGETVKSVTLSPHLEQRMPKTVVVYALANIAVYPRTEQGDEIVLRLRKISRGKSFACFHTV